MNKKNIFYIVVLILEIFFVSFVLVQQCGNQKQRELKHDASAVPYLMSNAGKTITVPGFTKIRFKAGEKYQSIFLSNPAGNDAEMEITVVMDNNTVYQSELISPGECVNNIEISEPLKAGTYDCVVEYRFYADGVQLNGMKNKCEMEVYR